MRLRFYPDEVLTTPALEIPEVTKAVQRKAANMLLNLRRWNGVGLAAPQVGWSARLFVANLQGHKRGDMVFVNPRITWRSKKTKPVLEECLSIPRFKGRVMRHKKVRVVGLNAYGEEIDHTVSGPLAIVVQHEVDHLDGVLFVEKLTAVDRENWKRFMRRCREAAKAKKESLGRRLIRRTLRND